MNGLLKKQVNESPLKKKFLAKELGIAQSSFSQVLKGEMFLDPEKEIKLKHLLKMVS